MSKQTGTFNKGNNAGTAECGDCGETRQKGNGQRIDNATGFICNKCWDRAGAENSVADGYMTPAAFHAEVGQHSEYCPDGCALTDETPVVVLTATLKVEQDFNRCNCGCGGFPRGKKSRFLPGHDAKALSIAKRAAAVA